MVCTTPPRIFTKKNPRDMKDYQEKIISHKKTPFLTEKPAIFFTKKTQTSPKPHPRLFPKKIQAPHFLPKKNPIPYQKIQTFGLACEPTRRFLQKRTHLFYPKTTRFYKKKKKTLKSYQGGFVVQKRMVQMLGFFSVEIGTDWDVFW